MVTQFVRGKSLPVLKFGLLILIVSCSVDWLLIEKLPNHHFHVYHYVGDVITTFVVMGVLWTWAWAIRLKLAKIDAYQASSYYQNMRITSAIQMLCAIVDNCDHNYDSGHEQCRAAARAQITAIRAALGKGPMPDLVKGGNGNGHISPQVLARPH